MGGLRRQGNVLTFDTGRLMGVFFWVNSGPDLPESQQAITLTGSIQAATVPA